MPTHTQTQQRTKAQTSPSEIFNHATQLASPLPSFVTLYLLVCLAACSLGSSVVSAVFPSFPFFCSSVQLFPRSPHQPPGQNAPSATLLDTFAFSRLSHCIAFKHRPIPFHFLLPACLDVVQFPSCLLPPWIIFSFLFFSFPISTTSSSALVWRESIILIHPPTLCPLYLSVSVCFCSFSSFLSSLASGPSPIFINIVLMIPDGLTCTLRGRSVNGFFQGCAWVVVCLCMCVCVGMHGCWVHMCIVVRTYVHNRAYMCACVWAHVFISEFFFSPGSRLLCCWW